MMSDLTEKQRTAMAAAEAARTAGLTLSVNAEVKLDHLFRQRRSKSRPPSWPDWRGFDA
jgi:hypothetical protein